MLEMEQELKFQEQFTPTVYKKVQSETKIGNFRPQRFSLQV